MSWVRRRGRGYGVLARIPRWYRLFGDFSSIIHRLKSCLHPPCNGLFIFWGSWVAPLGATIFILIGLVLVDFAHSWTENRENSESNLWQWILVSPTAGMYAITITLTGLMYGFFAGQSCTLNQFFIMFNLILCIIITVPCILPTVQEANPRSGLAQASMVALYCTYLIMSAVGNHTHATCNPLTKYAGARKRTVDLGTSPLVTTQPVKKDTPRCQAPSLLSRPARSRPVR